MERLGAYVESRIQAASISSLCAYSGCSNRVRIAESASR